MYFGSTKLLPKLVTTCRGKIIVDNSTRSLTLNERTFALPFVSSGRFCRSTALAMESCTKRTTESRVSRNYPDDSVVFALVRIKRTAQKSFYPSVRVPIYLLVSSFSMMKILASTSSFASVVK